MESSTAPGEQRPSEAQLAATRRRQEQLQYQAAALPPLTSSDYFHQAEPIGFNTARDTAARNPLTPRSGRGAIGFSANFPFTLSVPSLDSRTGGSHTRFVEGIPEPHWALDLPLLTPRRRSRSRGTSAVREQSQQTRAGATSSKGSASISPSSPALPVETENEYGNDGIDTVVSDLGNGNEMPPDARADFERELAAARRLAQQLMAERQALLADRGRDFDRRDFSTGILPQQSRDLGAGFYSARGPGPRPQMFQQGYNLYSSAGGNNDVGMSSPMSMPMYNADGYAGYALQRLPASTMGTQPYRSNEYDYQQPMPRPEPLAAVAPPEASSEPGVPAQGGAPQVAQQAVPLPVTPPVPENGGGQPPVTPQPTIPDIAAPSPVSQPPAVVDAINPVSSATSAPTPAPALPATAPAAPTSSAAPVAPAASPSVGAVPPAPTGTAVDASSSAAPYANMSTFPTQTERLPEQNPTRPAMQAQTAASLPQPQLPQLLGVGGMNLSAQQAALVNQQHYGGYIPPSVADGYNSPYQMYPGAAPAGMDLRQRIVVPSADAGLMQQQQQQPQQAYTAPASPPLFGQTGPASPSLQQPLLMQQPPVLQQQVGEANKNNLIAEKKRGPPPPATSSTVQIEMAEAKGASMIPGEEGKQGSEGEPAKKAGKKKPKVHAVPGKGRGGALGALMMVASVVQAEEDEEDDGQPKQSFLELVETIELPVLIRVPLQYVFLPIIDLLLWIWFSIVWRIIRLILVIPCFFLYQGMCFLLGGGDELVYCVYGVALAFFGGQYHTATAAIAAFNMGGGGEILEHFAAIRDNIKFIAAQTVADDAEDLDGDGVADVLQISNREFVKRKILLFLEHCDPSRLSEAIMATYGGTVGVLLTVSCAAAALTSLGVSMAMLSGKLAAYTLTPFIIKCMGGKYKQWVHTFVNYITIFVCLFLAFYFQEVTYRLQSALNGGCIFAESALMWYYRAVKPDPDFDLDTTMLDEYIGWSLAAVGLVFQVSDHVHVLHWPYNLFVAPLLFVNWLVKYLAGLLLS